jgi:hypothetical protein
MLDSGLIGGITSEYNALAPLLDERMRRQWAAAEANAIGSGGLTAVCSATRMSPTTVRRGKRELAARKANPQEAISIRIRKPGGGRKHSTDNDPDLKKGLLDIVDPVTRGDPMSPFSMDLPEYQQSLRNSHQTWPCRESSNRRSTLE